MTEVMATSVVVYSVTPARIAELNQMYECLTITGIDDKAGYEAVHSARMNIKGLRVKVQHEEAAQKKRAKDYIAIFLNKVDKGAKEVYEGLAPIEDYLKTEEETYTAAKDEAKEEAARLKKANLQDRIDRLAAYDYVHPDVFDLEKMDAVLFYEILKKASIDFEHEQVRLEEEAKAQAEKDEADRIEKDRIAAELAEQKADNERIKAEQEAAQAIIDAERAELQAEKDRIAAEKLAVERADEIRKAEAEAAEKAIKDERDKIEREKQAEETRLKAEQEEAERQESIRPDKAKLEAFADTIRGMVITTKEDFKSKKAQVIVTATNTRLNELAQEVKDKASKL